MDPSCRLLPDEDKRGENKPVRFSKNLLFGVNFELSVLPIMYKINTYNLVTNPEWRLVMTNYVCMYSVTAKSAEENKNSCCAIIKVINLKPNLRKLAVWMQNQLIMVLMLKSGFNFWCENTIRRLRLSCLKKYFFIVRFVSDIWAYVWITSLNLTSQNTLCEGKIDKTMIFKLFGKVFVFSFRRCEMWKVRVSNILPCYIHT